MDITTVFIMTMSFSMCLAVLMGLIGLVHRNDAYLVGVALTHVVPPLGLLLSISRDNIPVLFGVLIANTLIVMWPVFLSYAVRRMQGHVFPYARYIAVFSVYMAYYSWVVFVQDSDPNFTIPGYNVMASILVVMAIYDFTYRGPVPAHQVHKRWDVMAVLVLLGIYLLALGVRTLFALQDDLPPRFLDLSGRHVLVIIVMNVALYVLSVGLMWVWIRELGLGMQRQAQALERAHAESERLRAEATHFALHDSLTGAANRRKFDLDASHEIARVGRSQHGLCLMVYDIDHFKRINDAHGHAQGDAVLVNLTQVVQEMIRATDGLYRFGGEEFVLLLPDTDPMQATQLAERIRQRVAQDVDCHGHPVTISMGGAFYLGAGDTALDMFNRADALLYQAKADGRNRVIMAASPLPDSSVQA